MKIKIKIINKDKINKSKQKKKETKKNQI